MMKERVAAMFETPIKAITTVGTVITALGAIIGGVLTVDGRYVHAEDFKAQMQTQQYYQQRNIDTLRKQTIEDELFKLRLNPHPTQADKALIKRYEDQLDEIVQHLNSPKPPSR